MKVIGFVGSPRKGGNTAVLVNKILESAREKGAETEVVYINDLNIKGCQACFKCKTQEGCATQDDMQPLYQKINEAQAIVIGSPIYHGYISGQTKTFMDRWFAFRISPADERQGLKPLLKEGKKAVFVICHGSPDDKAYASIAKMLEERALNRWRASQAKSLIAPGTMAIDAVQRNENIMKAALDIGKSLVSSG